MSATTVPEESNACPACSAALDANHPDADGMLTCGVCGHRCYAGYLAEYAYLGMRRRWLWARLVDQSDAPDPATALHYGAWPATTPGPAPEPPAPVRHGSSISVQVLLISLGAFLLIVAGVVFVAVTWDVLGALGQAAMLLLATAAAAAAAIGLRKHVHRTAEALAVVAFALGIIDAVAAPAMGLLPESWLEAQHPYPFAVCLTAVAWGVLMGRWTGLRAWSWLGWLSTPVLVGSGLALAGRWEFPDQLQLTTGAVAYTLFAAALVVATTRPWFRPDRTPMWIAAGLSLTTAAGFGMALLGFDPPIGAIVVVALVLLLLLLAHERTGSRLLGYVGWPLFGFWLGLLGTLVDLGAWAPAVGGLVGVGVMFAIRQWGAGIAVTAAGTFWTTWLAAQLSDLDAWPDSTTWGWLFAIAGIGLFLYSWRATCAPVAWLGALSLQTAFVLFVDDFDSVEAVTLPLAALLLLAGLLQRHGGTRNSAIVYAPAVTMALIPSSLMVWNDVWSQPALLRFLVVMLAGIALLVVGVRVHMLGLIAPAAAAVSIAAMAQVFATLDTLPRWVALGIAGAVLLLIGARIEWVLRKRDQAEAWLHSLR